MSASTQPDKPATSPRDARVASRPRARWRPVTALAALLASAALTAGALPASAATRVARQATHVEVKALTEARAAEVAVTFTEVPAFSARLDSGNRRLVVDVADATVAGAAPALTDPVGVVGGVLTQAYSASGRQTTRILVTLREDARYRVTVKDRTLLVRLRPGAPGVDPGEAAAPAAKDAGPARISAVEFARQAGLDEVSIEGTRSSKFTESRTASGAPRLRLSGAELPAALERAMDVSAFGGAVTRVDCYRESGTGDVILDAIADRPLDARVVRRGTALVWVLAPRGEMPSSMTGVGADGGAARRGRTLHVEDDAAGEPVPTTRIGRLPQTGVERTQAPEGAAAFTPAIAGQAAAAAAPAADGRRIDLDLKDADIHNVLRLLADVGRVNIVTADDVSGQVTIRMRNIPWDQALDVVLQSKGLGMVQRGNIIRVAPLDQLQKEREMAIARRRQELQLAPLETRLIPVSYAQAGEIQARAKELLSARGSIAVDARTNVLIVRDVGGNLDQIEELTRSLDTQTPQVLVEARIVEATSRYLRDFGIQWGGDATFSAATGNPTGVAFPNSIGLTGGASDANTPTAGLSPFQRQVANPNFAVNLPAAVGTGSGGAIGLTFGSVDNNFNLNLRLSAAESNGMLRILSSPRILTLDNHEARISQGTLIPFSQVSAQGVQTTFQEAKLQLMVRPHVTADGSISMHVKINRDEPDFNQTSARGDPTILKREAETELLVMDGNTAVIGGIYTRNTGRNLDQVPFFGDIPLLGLLFQKRRASDTRGELVIFLTPRIVNRSEALGR